jgi:hypothetical protein
MHSLIDKIIVETIRSTGNAIENLPDRIEILQSHSQLMRPSKQLNGKTK